MGWLPYPVTEAVLGCQGGGQGTCSQRTGWCGRPYENFVFQSLHPRSSAAGSSSSSSNDFWRPRGWPQAVAPWPGGSLVSCLMPSCLTHSGSATLLLPSAFTRGPTSSC